MDGFRDAPGRPCFIKVQFLDMTKLLIVRLNSAGFELTYRAAALPEESIVHP
jgi:hypothetical protein